MARVGRFANYLRGILPCTDYLVTEMTAKAIGCLALAEGAYTAEYVEFEVRRALEWLSTDKNENKRLAAVSLVFALVINQYIAMIVFYRYWYYENWLCMLLPSFINKYNHFLITYFRPLETQR